MYDKLRSSFGFLSGKHEFWLVLVNLAVAAFFTISVGGSFLSLGNFVDLIDSYSIQTVLAVGLFVVLIAGGIDISFAGNAALAQYATGLLVTQSGLPGWICILLGIALGTLLGCVNAALIHYGRITSIIATIATGSFYLSTLMFLTGGTNIYGLPDWMTTPFIVFHFESWGGELINIKLPLVIMTVCVIIAWIMMAGLKVGRQLHTMGGNLEAARRVGADIAFLSFVAYGFLGFMAGVAGILDAHRLGQAAPNSWYGVELPILSAVVLGGARLTGGTGSVPGVLLGVLLLAQLQNGLNLSGVSSYFFGIVVGVVILASTTLTAVTVQRLRLRARAGNPGV